MDCGLTYSLDSVIQTFVVKIHSLSHIHPDTIKRIIQEKYKVLEIKEAERQDVIRLKG